MKRLAFIALTAVALAGCQDLTHQVTASDHAGPSEFVGPPFNPGPPDNPGRPDFLFENLNVARVCPASNRPGSFATIEEALNAVIPGGTIQVCDGTHVVQDIRVLKPVTIEAKGPGVPVLDGLGEAASGFTVNGIASGAGTVTFRGLRFEHMPETAILIDANYDVVLVENSQFFPNADIPNAAGISTHHARGNGITIQNNTFTGGWFGLAMNDTPGTVVLNNTFSGQTNAAISGPIRRIEGNTFTQCLAVCVGVDTEPIDIIGNSFIIDLNTQAEPANAVIGATADASSVITVRDNVITGIGGAQDPNDRTTWPIVTAVGLAHADLIEFSRNIITGAAVGLEVNEVHILTGSDNVIDAQIGISNEAASVSLHSNDIFGSQSPLVGSYSSGSLTCNWWGSASGPSFPPHVMIDPLVFTPWATIPVAGTTTTSCTGGS